MPEHVEIYPLIDEMAEKLYRFISRDEIQQQLKLGPLGYFITNLIAKDIER